MATKDFRASQIRTSQIIGSGSQSGKPAILVVSASDSSGFNGEALDNSTLLANVGSDVFLFVTGSKNTRTAVTLFGGDVVISGTMYAERQVVEWSRSTWPQPVPCPSQAHFTSHKVPQSTKVSLSMSREKVGLRMTSG